MNARDETWWVSPAQLDDYQTQVIKVPADSHALVLGPPGSGKTNLLLLRAAYLRRNKILDIEIIVFTRALRDFMRAGVIAGDYAELPIDNIKTYHAWARDFIRQNDGTIPEYPPAGERDGFYKYRLALLDAAAGIVSLGGYQGKCDAILIDECQDYLPAELELLACLTRRLFIVGDSRQKIYAGESAIDTAHRLVGDAAVHNLLFHYRTGRKICEAADAVMVGKLGYTPMVDGCNYDEELYESRVERVSVPQHALLTELTKRVRLQRAVYAGERIGVLTPRRQELETVRRHFEVAGLGSAPSNENVVIYDDSLVLSTAHSAKGLEFRATHIAYPHMIAKFPHQKGLAFTMLTRAKTSVTVYDTNGMPGFLEKAVCTEPQAADADDVSALFGGHRGKI